MPERMEAATQIGERGLAGGRRLWLAFVAVAFLLWGLGLSLVTGASKPTVNRLEASLRHNAVTEQVIPSRKARAWRPQRFDEAAHFLLYLPLGFLGVMAGAGGAFHAHPRLRKLVPVATIIGAFLWAAGDEYRQISIPTRQATWPDLFASWGGIATGVAIGLLIVWWRRRRSLAGS
jgi:VanZ family protein